VNGENWFQPPFIPIPPSLYDKGNGLNAAAIAVWGALARWVTDKDGHCWRTIADLAQDTKLSEATVQRAIRTLREKGWITVTLHHGTHSTYRLIWHGSDVVSMQTTEESDITQTSLLKRGSDVVSMQTTEESDITQTSLLKHGGSDLPAVKPLQQRGKNGKWHHTDVTSDITQRSDLYLVSRKEKDSSLFSLGQVGKTEVTQDKEQANQATDPPNAEWPCGYIEGHWYTGSEPTAWLRRRHSDVNVEIIIERTAVSLQANGAPSIKHGLSFLDYCCEHPFETVNIGWETTTEWLVQGWRHGQKAKRRVMKPGSP
jgi:predicted transcriptional regulator